jgi:hypothetical protein
MTASKKLIQSSAGNLGVPRPAKFLYVLGRDTTGVAENAFFVFDVTDPSSISEVQRIVDTDYGAGSFNGIVVDDDNDKLYISMGPNGDYLTYDINPSTGALSNKLTRNAGFEFDGVDRIGNGNLIIGTQQTEDGDLRIFDPANNSVLDSIIENRNYAFPLSIRMDKTRNEAIINAVQEEVSEDRAGRLYKFDVSDDTLTQLDFNEYGQDNGDQANNLVHWNNAQIALLFDVQDRRFRSFDTSSSGLPLLASGADLGSSSAARDFSAFFSAGRFYSINETTGPSRVDIFTIVSDGTIGTTGSYTLINNLSNIIIDTFSEVVYVVGAANPAHVFALDVSQSTITATEELDDLSVADASFNPGPLNQGSTLGLYFGPNTLNPE